MGEEEKKQMQYIQKFSMRIQRELFKAQQIQENKTIQNITNSSNVNNITINIKNSPSNNIESNNEINFINQTFANQESNQNNDKKAMFYTKFQPLNTKSSCSCTKIKCNQSYCNCYRTGRFCVDCECSECENKPPKNACTNKHPEVNERELLNSQKIVTCTCSKSGCNKNYCECFKNGVKCNKNCVCNNCLNMNMTNSQLNNSNLKEQSVSDLIDHSRDEEPNENDNLSFSFNADVSNLL